MSHPIGAFETNMKDVAEYNLFDVNPASPLATAHRSRARKTETYETQIKVYKDSARPVVTLMAHLADLICRFSLSLRSPQLKNRLLTATSNGFSALATQVVAYGPLWVWWVLWYPAIGVSGSSSHWKCILDAFLAG